MQFLLKISLQSYCKKNEKGKFNRQTRRLHLVDNQLFMKSIFKQGGFPSL